MKYQLNKSGYVEEILSGLGRTDSRAQSRPRQKTMWLKLQFNAVLGDTIRASLQKFLSHPGYSRIAQQAMGSVPAIQISFCRQLPNLSEKLGSMSDFKMVGARGR